MYLHFKNFIEGKNSAMSCRCLIFLDYKTFQEIEFSKIRNEYTIKFTELKSELVKKVYRVNEKEFYEKIKKVTENTIFNPDDYKMTRYSKLGNLISVWFN